MNAASRDSAPPTSRVRHQKAKLRDVAPSFVSPTRIIRLRSMSSNETRKKARRFGSDTPSARGFLLTHAPLGSSCPDFEGNELI